MLNGKKKVCYLVGQISPKFEESYNWRKYVIKQMKEYDDQISFINPCANPFNKKVLDEKQYGTIKHYRSFGVDVIPHKDYSFVLESDIAIVDLNQYDPNKPLLGSFFELAWYFVNPQKTVIGYADDLNSYLCQHPFVQGAVSTWVNDVDKAIYVLKNYFINA